MNGKVESHKDLTVWQKSMDLVVLVYKLMEQLPKEERYSLCDQIRRSADSIPSNIAEGKSRNSIKQYKQFVGIAKGSAAEFNACFGGYGGGYYEVFVFSLFFEILSLVDIIFCSII